MEILNKSFQSAVFVLLLASGAKTIFVFLHQLILIHLTGEMKGGVWDRRSGLEEQFKVVNKIFQVR